MIVGIDVRAGARAQLAGKGEYVYNLLPQLVQRSQHSFVLFLDQAPCPEWKKLSRVRFVILKLPAGLWQLLMFLYIEFMRPVDIYFSTTSLIIPALMRSVPTVTTLFDFVSFLFPRRHQYRAVILEKLWMKPAIHYSRALLAISEHTKKDAIKLFGANPSKITVTPLAPPPDLGSEPMDIPTSNAVLFVGTLEPRKNIVCLINAFNQVRAEGTSANLILAGKWGWHNQDIKSAIADSPFRSDIRVLGHVSSAQRQWLYQQARVLVFPSLYEGFGLPPLEAMAAGTPVITSNISALPEVVGKAAIMVDPSSSDELGRAINQVLKDLGLRQRLQIQGRDRAKLFNWQKTADLTLGVLNRFAK